MILGPRCVIVAPKRLTPGHFTVPNWNQEDTRAVAEISVCELQKPAQAVTHCAQQADRYRASELDQIGLGGDLGCIGDGVPRETGCALGEQGVAGCARELPARPVRIRRALARNGRLRIAQRPS